jgi:hypothetical protein
VVDEPRRIPFAARLERLRHAGAVENPGDRTN